MCPHKRREFLYHINYAWVAKKFEWSYHDKYVSMENNNNIIGKIINKYNKSTTKGTVCFSLHLFKKQNMYVMTK